MTYIKREDAIEHLKNVKVSYPNADISLPIDLAIKAISMIPSADVVQGKWITCHDVDYHTDIYECNKCHRVNWYPSNFCPSCGARMKGGAE